MIRPYHGHIQVRLQNRHILKWQKKFVFSCVIIVLNTL